MKHTLILPILGLWLLLFSGIVQAKELVIQWEGGSKATELKPLDMRDFPDGPLMEAFEKVGTPGLPWTEPITGMEFVWVPGGCYQMGSNSGSVHEKPVHEVCIDEVWMGKYEVTQAEWSKVMGSNPSRFEGERNPVEQVSWEDAQKFIKRLNAKGNGIFRLPTEAEWEYAARGGGKEERAYASNKSQPWFNFGARSAPGVVGTTGANSLGLYDMFGNVWEWCQDSFSYKNYSNHSRHNPVAISNNPERIVRGGGKCSGGAGACDHYFLKKHKRSFCVGFRIVKMSN